MTGKKRIRNIAEKKEIDRVPAYFESTQYVEDQILKTHELDNIWQIYEKYNIDLIPLSIRCKRRDGKKTYLNDKDYLTTGIFGEKNLNKWTGIEYNSTVYEYPINDIESLDLIDNVNWPDSSDFDYSTIEADLEKIGDRASIFGHWGPFQTTTDIINEENLYIAMGVEPEFCEYLFDRMHKFQMDHYENVLKAGKGKIDILRPHDDYGTQISTLFSRDMWKQYFAHNTKELVTLAHDYGALYQQHSCGAISNIIDLLIDCGVDGLEPIQPVKGMECETLKSNFGNSLYFVGGIDTQYLLPEGNKDKIKKTVEKYINTLGPSGYVLYPSQAWESCISVDTIDFFYNIDRKIY